MADDLGISNHLTLRNGVCQYVRRVPDDLRTAFPFARIQKSLRTRDPRRARAAALELDRLWDGRFAEARRAKGLMTTDEGPASITTDHWTWPDWQSLAAWFGACLTEEDWRARLSSATGDVLGSPPDLSRLPWRAPDVTKEHITRSRTLRATSVSNYATGRFGVVQTYVRRIGVVLNRSHPDHERFMAACLQAELAYLDIFSDREGRRGGLDQPHPDMIDGPWRRERRDELRSGTRDGAQEMAPAPVLQPDRVGKTLRDCRAKWIENRGKARKQARPEYLREMDHTVAAFEAHAGVTDIGQIRRKHVLAFRDHLGSPSKEYKVQTVNKKVGFISSLLSTALNAGWIETPLGPDIFLEVPEDEDRREPYGEVELTTLFAHPIFTAGYRFTRAKACHELQFWLPLIACLHGMISSEILQLGPDTVVPHPEAPEILCFEVTNAGDRRVKTLARRRYVPIRQEILDLGFKEVVSKARNEGWRWLWSDMVASSGNVTRVSGYFSSFWAGFSRDDLKITAEGTSLYSFRHAFQDRLSAAGHGDAIKKALMGHAESGMTGRYGAKKKPRVANIVELDRALQGLHWPFLKHVKSA
jgi:hypothetical protein